MSPAGAKPKVRCGIYCRKSSEEGLELALALIGRDDHFFDRGGTSLSAVKLAVALDRAVSLKDVVRHPVLADLAALIDTRTAARAATDLDGRASS